MSDENVPKRRRVLKACNRCRAMKSRCDVQRPICGRCMRYGYACAWADELEGAPEPTEGSVAGVKTLQRSFREYDTLICEVRRQLSETERIRIDLELSKIRRGLPRGALQPNDKEDPIQGHSSQTSPNTESDDVYTPVYLGEASDLSYMNQVRVHLGGEHPAPANDTTIETYEDFAPTFTNSEDDAYSIIPDKPCVDQLIDIYFSTIHVAYPYLCRPVFMAEYEKFWNKTLEITQRPSESWYITLVTMLAISAYYSSLCPQKYTWLEKDLHLRLFRRAQTAMVSSQRPSSLEYVQILLIQGFYMLATCQTSRSWMNLGTAIRTAQSLGLHVCDVGRSNVKRRSRVNLEMHRRVWYCLYVLDRLLSLQLGRPLTIDLNDCSVMRPSRLDDNQFNLMEDSIPKIGQDSQVGDYLDAVIDFSLVIEHTVRSIYGVLAIKELPAKLQLVETLDNEILQWRAALPRTLRFDIGHLFEKNAVLKRQRNMLEIKFSHLRSLIHRPFLCFSKIFGTSESVWNHLDAAQWQRVAQSERLCVSEAQKTIHLLHNVSDEESLVHDFPWWQMISCLTSACSILLVAQRCIDISFVASLNASEVLQEDITTCMSVLDALSINSKPALLAKNMLVGLQRVCEKGSENPELQATHAISASTDDTHLPGQPSDYDLTIIDKSFPADLNGNPWPWVPYDTTEDFLWSQNLLNSTNQMTNTRPVASAEVGNEPWCTDGVGIELVTNESRPTV